MASNKADASGLFSTIEELKASRREIHSQHANLGLQISTLDARISTLESQLREYVGRDSEVMPASDTINLKVKGQDGRVVCFTMKRCTRMEKLIQAWCDPVDANYEDVRLFFKGRRLETHKTPEQLDMEDGAEIDVLMRIAGS